MKQILSIFLIFLSFNFSNAQTSVVSKSALNKQGKQSNSLEKKLKFQKLISLWERRALMTLNKDSLKIILDRIVLLKKKKEIHSKLKSSLINSSEYQSFSQLRALQKIDSIHTFFKKIGLIVAHDFVKNGSKMKGFASTKQYLDSLKYFNLIDSIVYTKLQKKLDIKLNKYKEKLTKNSLLTSSSPASVIRDSLNWRDSIYVKMISARILKSPRKFPLKIGFFVNNESLLPDFRFNGSTIPNIATPRFSLSPGVEFSLGNIGDKFRLALNYKYVSNDFYTYLEMNTVQNIMRVRLENFQYNDHQIGLETQLVPNSLKYFKHNYLGFILGVRAHFNGTLNYKSLQGIADFPSEGILNKVNFDGVIGINFSHKLPNSRGLIFSLKYNKGMSSLFNKDRIYQFTNMINDLIYYTNNTDSGFNSISSTLTLIVW